MNFFDIYALIALFTFYTLLISKSLLTSRKGKQVLTLGRGKQGRQRALEVSFYAGIVLLTYLVWTAAAVKPVFGLQTPWLLYHHVFGAVCGFIALNAGIVLFAFGLASFKDAWRIGVDHERTDTLITDGIFAYSRNPIYLAMMLIFTGYFLTYPNFFFLGSFVFIMFAFNWQIAKEEILLERLFGIQYLRYKNQTYKFIGKKRTVPNKNKP